MPPEITDPLAQQIVTFLLGGGAVGAMAALGRFIWKWRTGRIASERDRNTSLVNDRVAAIKERRDAEAERDTENREKRRAIEEITRLRVLLLNNGINPGPEPEFERTIQPPKRGRGKTAAE